MRTPRGRVATPQAYKHFGIAMPKNNHNENLW
jgi:Holliday junction DNA helicase RuvB